MSSSSSSSSALVISLRVCALPHLPDLREQTMSSSADRARAYLQRFENHRQASSRANVAVVQRCGNRCFDLGEVRRAVTDRLNADIVDRTRTREAVKGRRTHLGRTCTHRRRGSSFRIVLSAAPRLFSDDARDLNTDRRWLSANCGALMNRTFQNARVLCFMEDDQSGSHRRHRSVRSAVLHDVLQLLSKVFEECIGRVG